MPIQQTTVCPITEQQGLTSVSSTSSASATRTLRSRVDNGRLVRIVSVFFWIGQKITSQTFKCWFFCSSKRIHRVARLRLDDPDDRGAVSGGCGKERYDRKRKKNHIECVVLIFPHFFTWRARPQFRQRPCQPIRINEASEISYLEE